MSRNAILTGSRAYGTPGPDSDTDLVVLVSAGDLIELCRAAGMPPPTAESVSLRFGKLNLICTASTEWFNSWEEGTEALRAQAPVKRSDAVNTFQSIWVRRGLRGHGY